MRWKRERNMRWTKFSDTDPTIVHLAYSSSLPGSKHLRASPCAKMQLLGQSYGEPTDDEANCIDCFANEPDDESMRGDRAADG